MRRLLATSVSVLSVSAVLLTAGCGDSDTANLSGTATATGEKPESPEKKGLGEAVENSGVAVVETYEVSVPAMSCPYGCYPTVAKTLSEMDGVAKVRLADPTDAEDGEIEDRRVFVEVGEGFDLDAALAKLKEASFPAEAKKADAGA